MPSAPSPPSRLHRLRFAWVVGAAGAVLMALEILSSRLLAPRFGNSVYVWGSIISVFLAALALGYWWGGRRADRDPTLAGVGRLLALAGLAQGVVLLAGPRAADLLGSWSGGTPWGTLVATTLLFAPPSVLLATVSPYAVRLAATGLERLGHTTGQVYALSTAGSLAGTLGCTFGLIPWLDLPAALSVLLATTAATALVALIGMPGERWAPALAGLLLVLAVIGPPALGGGDAEAVYERMTPYQTLQVVDRNGVRYLESDGAVHGAVRADNGELAMSYPRLLPAAWLIAPEIRKVLILGMGGGNVADYLLASFPELTIDFVDVDPAVPEVARRFMGFRDRPGVRVHIADGRRFLETSAESWDLIVADTYIGLSVPFHLTTREFLREVKTHLAPRGVFAINLAADLDAPFPRAICHTLESELPTLYVFSTPTRNYLVFASQAPPVAQRALIARARRLDRATRFDPSLTQLARRRLKPPAELARAPILTDAYAPVDRLIQLDRTRLPAAAVD